MSTFGDGTFKEDVLWHIRDEASHHGLSKAVMMVELLDVVRYLAEETYGSVLKDLADEARESVREELINKLGGK